MNIPTDLEKSRIEIFEHLPSGKANVFDAEFENNIEGKDLSLVNTKFLDWVAKDSVAKDPLLNAIDAVRIARIAWNQTMADKLIEIIKEEPSRCPSTKDMFNEEYHAKSNN